MFQGNQTLPVWSTNISIAGTRNSVAQILDSGNLVLIQNDTRKALLWQSFAHPTNTWLSFMKLGVQLKNRSSIHVLEVSRMIQGVSPQMVLYKGSDPLWRSGTWTGQKVEWYT
ncbi:hypothetical protein V6N11_034260 [Hibiscus sabdariffa]|uniref:Bulb-type lectin domain-containing protein n=1 Tax=Hibiscus sabdariffa TaxID=183260 RepID=A0ABR2N8F0_9ROSI